MSKEYTYLISYFFTNQKGSQGWGNVDLKQPMPMEEIEHVRSAEKLIAENGHHRSVIIMNIVLLKEEDLDD